MTSSLLQDVRIDAKKRREAVQEGGLCRGCLWDCVQPLGVTVACPSWQARPHGEPRRTRQGQQRFDFARNEKD